MGSASDGPGGTGTPAQIACACAIYISLNVFLNFFNKWALSPEEKDGLGFTFPVFYSMCHMIMSVAGAAVTMKIKPPATGPPTVAQFLEYRWEVLALAACTTINICCNNASLMMIGLFVNQVLKSTSPLVTMIMSYAVLGRKYPWQLVATVCVVAVSAGCAAHIAPTALHTHAAPPHNARALTRCAVPFNDPSVTLKGIILVAIATLASSTKPVVGELLMATSDKPKLAPAALVFYDSGISFFAMLIYWLSVTSERTGSVDYLADQPLRGLGILLTGSLTAFA